MSSLGSCDLVGPCCVAGSVFLSSQPTVMTALVRALVPPNMEELQMEEEDMLTLAVKRREGGKEEGKDGKGEILNASISLCPGLGG